MARWRPPSAAFADAEAAQKALRSLGLQRARLAQSDGRTNTSAAHECAALRAGLCAWVRRARDRQPSWGSDAAAFDAALGALEALPSDARAWERAAFHEPSRLASALRASSAACTPLIASVSHVQPAARTRPASPGPAAYAHRGGGVRTAPPKPAATFGRRARVRDLDSARRELRTLEHAAARGARAQAAADTPRARAAAAECARSLEAVDAWLRALRVPGALDGGASVRAEALQVLGQLPSSEAGWWQRWRERGARHSQHAVAVANARPASAPPPAPASSGVDDGAEDGRRGRSVRGVIERLLAALLPLQWAVESGAGPGSAGYGYPTAIRWVDEAERLVELLGDRAPRLSPKLTVMQPVKGMAALAAQPAPAPSARVVPPVRVMLVLQVVQRGGVVCRLWTE